MEPVVNKWVDGNQFYLTVYWEGLGDVEAWLDDNSGEWQCIIVRENDTERLRHTFEAYTVNDVIDIGASILAG